MAQYTRGHLARVARIAQLREAIPGLELAGNAYRGIGVPDCLASGIQAASNVMVRFGCVKPDLRVSPGQPKPLEPDNVGS